MPRRPIQPGIRASGEDDERPGSVSREAVREAFSHWATGVALLAARDGPDLEAITVTAFSPVSVDPPLVLCCLHEQAAVLPIVAETGRFTVSVLPESEGRTASIAADRVLVRTLPFEKEGDPVLAGALVSFVCRLHANHPGGDHRVLVGEVERVALGPDADPLLYYRREYGSWRER